MGPIHQYTHPYVCTDAVVFAITTKEADSYRRLPSTKLSILLYQRDREPFQKRYCLPGGFLNIDELPEDSIRRKLSDKTKLQNCYLEQLFTFCGRERDPRGRVISVAYLGLMNERMEGLKGRWFDIVTENGKTVFCDGELKLSGRDLGFDHGQIIETGLQRLRSRILYSDIGFHLLPDTFTLTQLQNVFEAVTGKKDTPANFRRKVGQMVTETGELTVAKGYRPAKLFKQHIQ